MKRRPAVRVLSVDVAPELDEELHDVKVSGADGVVESGDAFVVGSTRVGNLTRSLPDKVKLTLKGSIEKQGQKVEADRAIKLSLSGDLGEASLKRILLLTMFGMKKEVRREL